MLDKVKNALRIKTTAFDDEVQGLIDACKADLRLVGVNVPEEKPPAEGETPSVGDPLITRAIILYAKAHFGFSEDSEKYQKAYDYLKCTLALSGNYTRPQEPETMDYEKLENKPTLDGVPIVGDVKERDPTVPQWAKEETRPVYTAEDVGAIGEGDIKNISVEALQDMWRST